jgi:predicted Zn-dependent peptidase
MRNLFCLGAVLAMVLAGSLGAQDLESRVVERTLPNGLRYLFVERQGAPIFSARLYVKVGGVDDPQGNSGLAHLFEHMAFKGTPSIGTTNYDAELPIMARIDSVALLFTAAGRLIPLADREMLNGLDQEWIGRVHQAAGRRLDRPELIPLLIDSLTALTEPVPSMDAHLSELKHELVMLELRTKQDEFVVKDEFTQITRASGGNRLNAGTGRDYTVYYVSFPSNRFELWAMLESERIIHPVMREFYSERDVVSEERRMRVDTDPDGNLYEQFLATAFQVHPYRVPIVGWQSEVNQVTAETARAFRATYYSPGNMVAVLVGDLKATDVHEKMTRYFGRIPQGPPPPDVTPREPKQLGERRVYVEDDASPRVMIGYHKPTMPHFDDYVFDVLHGILGDGRTSRLYERLVKAEDRVASKVSTSGAGGGRYDNLFVVDAQPIGDATTADIEAKVYEVIGELADEPVPERELQKIKNQVRANFLRGLSTNSGLASRLGYFHTVAGDWRYVANHRQVIDRITAADVQRVAREYFTVNNRTVATRTRRTEVTP